ncbi:MAG: hypothetical protein JWO62_1456 [Acidimicrobiaceae bacterium]|nr:hypothetical protein [Acidimicrobiaceae bacterium]
MEGCRHRPQSCRPSPPCSSRSPQGSRPWPSRHPSRTSPTSPGSCSVSSAPSPALGAASRSSPARSAEPAGKEGGPRGTDLEAALLGHHYRRAPNRRLGLGRTRATAPVRAPSSSDPGGGTARTAVGTDWREPAPAKRYPPASCAGSTAGRRTRDPALVLPLALEMPAMPADGQMSASGHCAQRGRRAVHTSRPSRIRRRLSAPHSAGRR